MDRDALHARIRRLLFVSPALATSFSQGEFRSIFRGRGLDFDSLRDYGAEEDARLIDWNVTARLGKPYVRSYREDRSLILFLLVDLSASMEVGGGEVSKRDQALLAASLLAYAGRLRGMPVGCLYFARGPLRYFPPKTGGDHALALVEAGIECPASEEGSDIAGALATATRLLKRRSLVILLSDFLAANYGGELGIASRRHDLVAFRIGDRIDEEPPAIGSWLLRDAEGGGKLRAPFFSGSFREKWRAHRRADLEGFKRLCASRAVPFLELDTEDDPALALLGFFEKRRRGK